MITIGMRAWLEAKRTGYMHSYMRMYWAKQIFKVVRRGLGQRGLDHRPSSDE